MKTGYMLFAAALCSLVGGPAALPVTAASCLSRQRPPPALQEPTIQESTHQRRVEPKRLPKVRPTSHRADR